MHEWGTSLGLQTVTASCNPCQYCKCQKYSMYQRYHARSMLGLPWEERGEAEHEETCGAREIVVHVYDEGVRRRIIDVGCPTYPKNKKARGRAISRDVPELHLLANDRIEPGYDILSPGAYLTDPAELDTKNRYRFTSSFGGPGSTAGGSSETGCRGAIQYSMLLSLGLHPIARWLWTLCALSVLGL